MHTEAREPELPASGGIGRMQDRLPTNAPYEGVVAEAYDAWISVEAVFPDDAVYEAILTEVRGTVLELGCGTGRPMLRWLAAGHDVEGIDSSSDMLAILRRNAAARGVEPIVHHGDIAPLQLEASYAAILCPAGTFTLIDDETRIRLALASYLDRLVPGGSLGLSLSRLESTGEDSLRWRIRRTGTLDNGMTVVVHEALLKEPGDPCQTGYNRIETFDPAGRLTGTLLRRVRLRSWEQDEARSLLEAVGFVDVVAHGTADDWVTVARRPG